MLAIALYSPLKISETVRDRLDSKRLPIGNGLRESNGHVTDDFMWPRKVKLVTTIRLEPNISKTARDVI